MNEKLRAVHTLIDTKVIDRGFQSSIFEERRGGWIFDFRSVLLSPESLNMLTRALWDKIRDYDRIQIGGMESAAIPLVTSLVLKAHQEQKSVSGFYIRKSRKKSGLMRHVEGTLNDNPIILVDDLMNSGESKMRQVEVLEALGKRVSEIVVVVRFNDLASYEYFHNKGIKITSLFTLDDFNLKKGYDWHTDVSIAPHTRIWSFSPGKPVNHKHVVPRSVPIIQDNTLYFGTSTGHFWALDKKTGMTQWKFTTGRDRQEKVLLSSPVIHNNMVLFGAYDGKFYALDTKTGEPSWVFTDCDYIGSSPAVAREHGLVYVGLEHSLPREHGSVVCLKADTGSKVWEYPMPALTHASPLYISEHVQIAIGSNEGVLYLLNAYTGELVWKFETEGGQRYRGFGGFSPGDIKMRAAYDADTDSVAFCSMDGYLYVLDRATGTMRFRVHTEYYDTSVRSGIYGSPLFTKTNIYFAGLDKRVYCHNKETGALVWKFDTSGRIFSTPRMQDGNIFIGSNDGRLYELDAKTGAHLRTTQFTERITNEVVFDQEESSMYIVLETGELHAFRLQK